MAAPRVFRDERKLTYLNVVAADRPLASPVSAETHAAARRYRLARVREQLDAFDCTAILLYDPVNIRYALDVSNMALWMAHNPTNYALIVAGGPAIYFGYSGSEHLAAGLEGVDEVRSVDGVHVPGRPRPRGRRRRGPGLPRSPTSCAARAARTRGSRSTSATPPGSRRCRRWACSWSRAAS